MEQLEFGSSLKSPSDELPLAFPPAASAVLAAEPIELRSDRSPAVNGGHSNNARGSFALSRYSASFAAAQSPSPLPRGDDGTGGGRNEVNLIRQATRFRALVNRETLLGQMPRRVEAADESSARWFCARTIIWRRRLSVASFLPEGRPARWLWIERTLARLRTDTFGIDEAAAQACPATSDHRRRASRPRRAPGGRRGCPVLLTSNQSSRAAADGLGRFRFVSRVVLVVGYGRGPTVLRSRGVSQLILRSSLGESVYSHVTANLGYSWKSFGRCATAKLEHALFAAWICAIWDRYGQ